MSGIDNYAPFQRLVLLHRVLEAEPGPAMGRFLTAVREQAAAEESYLQLVRAVYARGPVTGPAADAWQNHLLHSLLYDENPFSRSAASGQTTPQMLEAAAHDLRLLQRLYAVSGETCRELTGNSRLPLWPGWPAASGSSPAAQRGLAILQVLHAAPDWGELAPQLAAFYRWAGAGLTAAHWYLRWDGEHLAGIANPDASPIDELVGLTEAKATVLQNTEQFLKGGTANNLLLYGSRGTGKSTMVRSLPLRYGERGLRLVEVGREAMGSLPALFRVLKGSPQRFLLFFDDLSFDEAEVGFKSFKSMVEGALEQQPANVQLYATSNRRHLVPERWSDRHTPDTAEVHGQDAMEEKLSLADRFGVTVLFPSPDQEEYLAIVRHLVSQRGLSAGGQELQEAALRWVMRHNTRSGRSARQFVDDLAGRMV